MGRARVRDDFALSPGYHSPQIEVDVRLNTNESPFAPPQGYADALASEISRISWNRYPDRAATKLRQGIARHHGVDPAMVFAANGSNEVLQTVMLAFSGAGRKVLTFEPTYAMHGQIARTVGAEVVEGERAGDFSVDDSELRRLSHEHKPAITFLCSPNNPTGTVDPLGLVETALEAANAHDGLVLVDEAYGQFATHSALDLVDEDRSLVVTRTYSKTWAMAAVRLGYLVGPTWLVSELEKVVLPYHLDSMTQVAGEIALRYVEEMDERVALLIEERERLSRAMADLDLDVFASGANFILIRPQHHDGDAVWQGLLDRSVLVRNCSSWPRLANCLRVTIGTETENTRFLIALQEVLS
jgi:histidinol-phosphate aminotransferase